MTEQGGEKEMSPMYRREAVHGRHPVLVASYDTEDSRRRSRRDDSAGKEVGIEDKSQVEKEMPPCPEREAVHRRQPALVASYDPRQPRWSQFFPGPHTGEKWSEHTHMLQPFGDYIYIQKLVGNHPRKWERTGVVWRHANVIKKAHDDSWPAATTLPATVPPPILPAAEHQPSGHGDNVPDDTPGAPDHGHGAPGVLRNTSNKPSPQKLPKALARLLSHNKPGELEQLHGHDILISLSASII
ncbi:hypothetical protein PoB_001073600 [Plakobranchus ocellatus]|uniref:2'-phosphotransferase n=1 Tax=Plakobranchus ocellatus TaxID=259542 RepID=A0AAV3YAE2_9GAST|nr:hypothetical protein PoB_001073600 [Plakobranchus ocellatus]